MKNVHHCFFYFYLIYEGDVNYTNTILILITNELYNNIIFCNYIVLLCIIILISTTLTQHIFSFCLCPLHPTPQLRNSGLKGNVEYPTRNKDFVVAFRCVQLVNTTHPTGLDKAVTSVTHTANDLNQVCSISRTWTEKHCFRPFS